MKTGYILIAWKLHTASIFMSYILLITFELDNVADNFGIHQLWINDCQDRSLSNKQTKSLGKDSYMTKPPYYESLYNNTFT